MNNVLSNTTKDCENISLKVYSKKLIYIALYKFNYMAEASFTRNMDVCVVDKNKIINTSQKTTSALITITQKKAKILKDVEPHNLFLWIRLQTITSSKNKESHHYKPWKQRES